MYIESRSQSNRKFVEQKNEPVRTPEKMLHNVYKVSFEEIFVI
jgi:hypothetical protein